METASRSSCCKAKKMGHFPTKPTPYHFRMPSVNPCPFVKPSFNSHAGDSPYEENAWCRSQSCEAGTEQNGTEVTRATTESSSPASVFSHLSPRDVFPRWPAESHAIPTSLAIGNHPDFPCSELLIPCTHTPNGFSLHLGNMPSGCSQLCGFVIYGTG